MEEAIELNLIRIGTGTRVNGVLRFANVLLKERNFREIHFRALGASIGKLVSVVELLKLTHPGMYQINTIGTVAFQLKETDEHVMNERLYPKLEIILSLDPPKVKGIGYQDKMNEEERMRLCGIMERSSRGGHGIVRGGRGSRERGRGFSPRSYIPRVRGYEREREDFYDNRNRSESFNSSGGEFSERGGYGFSRGRGRGRRFGGTRGFRQRGLLL